MVGLWQARRDVSYRILHTKSLRARLADGFLLDWELPRSPHGDGQTVVVTTPPAESPRTLGVLRLLASWADSAVSWSG
jgi:hypothetical protein